MEEINIENNETVTESFDKKTVNLRNIIIVLAVAVIAVLVFMAVGGKETAVKETNVVYVKDNALYMHDDSKGEVMLAENMGDMGGFSSYFFGYGNAYSDDNSVMYFVSDITADGAYSLSKVKTDKPEDVVFIDDMVISYNISNDGSAVGYIRVDDNKLGLYAFDGTNKYTVREEVGITDYYFQLSDDGRSICFAEETDDGSFDFCMVSTDGTNKKVIAEDITDFAVLADNELVYTRTAESGNLEIYTYKNNKQTLVADEVVGVSFFENNEGFIFIEEGTSQINIWDIVVDDMAEVDSKMEAPLFADYGHENQDAYMEASNAYAEKQMRDRLREQIEENPYTKIGYNLYRYDNDGTKFITDNVINTAVFGKNGECIVVDEVSVAQDGYKVLLSEISDLDMLPNIYARYENAGETYVITNNVKAPIETDDVDIQSSKYDEASGKLLFAKSVDSYSGAYNPVVVEMKKGEVSKYSYIEDRVNFADFCGNGNVAYVSVGGYLLTTDNNENGEAEALDEGVSYMVADKDDGSVYYINNMSAEDYTGNFKVLKNGDVSLIDTGVTYADVIENGKVVYIKNYDEYAGLGDLYIYDGGKAVLLAEGITCVMDID